MNALGLNVLVLAWLARGENRLWYLDLELRGGCEAVRLDCGVAGETRLTGPFSEAEDRRMVVPVPVRSPGGVAGLAALPLPRAEVVPADASASVRVLGWSREQPAERLFRQAGALLDRPRPPSGSRAPRAARVELLLVLAAGGFLLALRRRLALALALALGTGLLALQLARGRTGAARSEGVLEWETGGASALSVLAAADGLVLPRAALEVEPEGLRLEFELESAGQSGTVHALGARLTALELAPPPALLEDRNGAEALAEVWTRGREGRWRTHGPWAFGTALRPSATESGLRPPGWLASGLPPGRGVLLARTEHGAWLRCLGFELE